jgi:transcriptional regulator with XRE-family HTH domain
MESPRPQFAENLRRHRKRQKLSQQALADLCDLHRSEISLLECKKRSPKLETLVVLTRALGVRSCQLVEGEDIGPG